ncbi:putative Ion transport domain-containing protein [Helianthus anomalus]
MIGNQALRSMVYLRCVTLFAVHCAGCFYYYLAATYPYPGNTWIGNGGNDNFKNEPLGVRYVTSMYLSITIFTNGDPHAQNRREMIFVICYMLFNLGLTCYLIGNMTNLVVHGTSKTRQFVSTLAVTFKSRSNRAKSVGFARSGVKRFGLRFRTAKSTEPA